MEDATLRNFRDFLTIYNQMTELCFSRCVDDLNYRNLTPDEEECVDKCARKHVNINHKMMSIYMEVQPQIVSRRIEEMNKQAQNVAEQENVSATQTTPTDALTTNQEISTERTANANQEIPAQSAVVEVS